MEKIEKRNSHDRNQRNYCSNADTDAVGTNDEFYIMDKEEKIRVIEIFAKKTAGP